MPLVLILVLAAYLLGNVYIFVKGLHALAALPLWMRGVYCTAYWLCALMLFASFFFRHANRNTFSSGSLMFGIGAGWLVFVLYMLVFLACTDIYRLFNKDFNYGFFVALGLTVILLSYGYINYRHTRKQVFNIVLNKPLNENKGVRIAGVSDLHLGLGTDLTLLHRNIDLINAEQPDVILIAGDLFDNSVEPARAKQMERELNRLKAPLGVWFAYGNHDYMSGIDECAAFIREKTDIHILCDTVVTLPNGLQLLGRDDRRSPRRRSADEFLRCIDPEKPLVIIDHQPVELHEAKQLGATLQFSGHTHHGQVIPLSWLTDLLFDLSYGFAVRDNVNYYVSSGLSLWGPPFRIGTECEFVIFEAK